MLSQIFNKKNLCYKSIESDQTNNQQNQHQNQHLLDVNPKVRMRNIETFRFCNGFNLMHAYLLARLPYCVENSNGCYQNGPNHNFIGTKANNTSTLYGSKSNTHITGFPSLETISHILKALFDSLPNQSVTDPPIDRDIYSSITNQLNDLGILNDNPQSVQYQTQLKQQPEQTREMDAINMSKAVMLYFDQLSMDHLQWLPLDQFAKTFQALRRIFDRLGGARRTARMQFYTLYRSIVLSMICSTSLSLKLFGWEQVNNLIDACSEHRPPPLKFRIYNSGVTSVNGIYEFAGTTTPDGYAKHDADTSYIRTVPSDAKVDSGKKFTLFLCTMRNKRLKRWFISEVDNEEPGTDRDVDYYQHKSKDHEWAHPPTDGWITCQSAGVDPPPSLQPIGYMLPSGQEMNTLEQRLANWAIENELVEKVLSDSTSHPVVVAHALTLVKFLATSAPVTIGLWALHLRQHRH
jgi:hypothetical protein